MKNRTLAKFKYAGLETQYLSPLFLALKLLKIKVCLKFQQQKSTIRFNNWISAIQCPAYEVIVKVLFS